MPDRILLAIFLVASGLATAAGGAAELHVAPDGSDDGAGSQARPWRTLQRAVDAARPGDVIVVRAGTYAGARIEGSGSRRRPIVLRAAAGAEVVLDRLGAAARHDGVLEIERFGGVVSDWRISGFEIVGAPRAGIDVRGARRIVVENNRVRDSGRSGIFTAFADRVTVADNESFANGEHGIYLSNSGDRPRVRGNLLYSNAASGLHMNGDASQGGDGVISRAVIEGNVIFDNGRLGGSGVNLDGVTRSRVVNNLIFGEHASGISLYRIDGAVCSRSNRVFHNTVLTAADGRWAFNMPDAGCTGNRVVNNIFLSGHPFRGSIAIAGMRPGGFVSRHNVVDGRYSVDGGETVVGRATWRRLGHGEGSLAAGRAALFTEPEGGDFELRAGSPAIDAGAPLAAVRRDLAGRRRPQGGGPDIGAFELPEPGAALW